MKGRIKRGAKVFQDSYSCTWPQCVPPSSEYEGEEYKYVTKDADRVFRVEYNGRYWDCKAEGYGLDPDYGNGSVFAYGEDAVELVEGNEKIDMSSVLETLFNVFDDKAAYALNFVPFPFDGEQLGCRVVRHLKRGGGGGGDAMINSFTMSLTDHVYVNADDMGAVGEALMELFEADITSIIKNCTQLRFDTDKDYGKLLHETIIRYKLEDPQSHLAVLADEKHFPFPMSEGHTVMFMTQAYAQANRSYAKDLKVGAVLVEALPNNLHRIISDGYNGTEPKAPNACEDENGESLPDVIHAERNLFRKLMRSNESGVGSILFVTRSPCIDCVERVIDAGVAHVVYCEEHVNPAPMLRLMRMGVKFSKVPKELIISNVEDIAQRLKQPKFNECPDCEH